MENTQLIILTVVAMVAIALLGFLRTNELALVQGDSMAPTFSNCTLAVVNHEFAPSDLLPGDIASVDISSQNAAFSQVAHRVVENNTEQQVFSTRGDNDSYYAFPSSIDGFFSYSEFQGLVTNNYNIPEFFCKQNGGEN